MVGWNKWPVQRVLELMTNRATRISARVPLHCGIVLLAIAIGGVGALAEPPERADAIDKLMTTLHERGQFNGAILVAEHGDVLYRRGFGKADISTGIAFAPDTISDIGSVTKQFTAMAVMILAEHKRLSYDDLISKYIPEFTSASHLGRITVRQLLTHTSGIPDYGDLGIDDSGLDQNSLIAAVLKRDAEVSKPGIKYRYSNVGYVLLAIIVQRVSGQGFSDFLAQEIFQPCGMRRTFVYDGWLAKRSGMAVGYDTFGQVDNGGPTSKPGDGGIYSTVDDLFRWDQILNTEKLVTRSTLAEAFTPATVKEGTSTYGFGWNVGLDGTNKYVWHTGSHAGFRAFIERRLNQQLTVIMLTNMGNSKRLEINSAIQNILAGQPYILPKQSGAQELYRTIHESGIEKALQRYEVLKRGNEYDLGESELNSLGYQVLYGDRNASGAIDFFKLNSIEHPLSSNTFDSLAEAYEVNGERDRAILSYGTAVILDPSNGHAKAMLRKLRFERRLLWSICVIGGVGALVLLVVLVLRRRRISTASSPSRN
jgi:CubicO group peptidase (beta-lactamase class C family)